VHWRLDKRCTNKPRFKKSIWLQQYDCSRLAVQSIRAGKAERAVHMSCHGAASNDNAPGSKLYDRVLAVLLVGHSWGSVTSLTPGPTRMHQVVVRTTRRIPNIVRCFKMLSDRLVRPNWANHKSECDSCHTGTKAQKRASQRYKTASTGRRISYKHSSPQKAL